MDLKNLTNFDFTELNRFSKIFVLISGGIDSTYLFEIINQMCDKSKIFAVNCYNPYEHSKTLNQFKKLDNFIEIKPENNINYLEVLKDAFKQLNKAAALRFQGKYYKKFFNCCTIIKHQAFKNHPLFCEPNTVIISGIKAGNGKMRAYWCKDLRERKTFYHKHKNGQLYCYPFRDYKKRELSVKIINELRKKYLNIAHSGCIYCPVLILFRINNEKRYYTSLNFLKQMIKDNSFVPSKLLLKYNPDLNIEKLANFIQK